MVNILSWFYVDIWARLHTNELWAVPFFLLWGKLTFIEGFQRARFELLGNF